MPVNFAGLFAWALRVALTFAGLTAAVSIRADSSATFPVGGTVRISVASDGSGPFRYQWKKNGADIPGATSAVFTFANAQFSDSGSYSVSVSNAVGSAISDVALIGVGAAPPSFVNQPASQVVNPGASATLSVAVAGSSITTVQWQRNGVDIPGATNLTLTLGGVNASNSGTYTAVVTNFIGSLTSVPAIVALRGTNRLANVSIRAMPGAGAQTLIVGFVTVDASKSILMRMVGPGLAAYTASATYADPVLELYDGTSAAPTRSNDDWGGGAELSSAFQRLGAFSLPNGSKDSVLLSTLAPKVYGMQLKGSGAGMALAEIYDADASNAPAGRIVNLSARTQVGVGDGVLVAGFVIAGNGPKTLLIRAVGPTLGTFGVPDFLAEPSLELYAAGSSAVLKANDSWGGAPELTNAFAVTGAFSLMDGSSKDAAMLVTLNPGAYSAIVSGKNSTTGVALVEIYEMP